MVSSRFDAHVRYFATLRSGTERNVCWLTTLMRTFTHVLTKTIEVNGSRMGYEDHGKGSVLLFIHGHPFDSSMWHPQIKAFASRKYRVIAPDLRGYGDTPVSGDKTTLGMFAEDLEALLVALRIREPIVLCGLSMGGQIAMEFCKRYPDRVAGLALAATVPQKETVAGKRLRANTAARLQREGIRPYARELLPKMLAPATIRDHPHLALYVQQMMNAASPAGCAAALLGRAERPGYEDVLANFKKPSLIVVGYEDAFTTFEDARHMHMLLKDSELVLMEGVGHMPNLECVEEFNFALTRLLKRIARRASVPQPRNIRHRQTEGC